MDISRMASKEARYIPNASVPIEGRGQEPRWRKQSEMDGHLTSALLFQFYNFFSNDEDGYSVLALYPRV
ncbi:hypothetical protein BM1_01242 [Bipolaris maydis]|nr:hypothetical protein BM1_01242 [Bipolaris maydis]